MKEILSLSESVKWGHFFCPIIGTCGYITDSTVKNETLSSVLKCPCFFVCWIPELLCNFLNPIYYKYNFINLDICYCFRKEYNTQDFFIEDF